MWTVIQDYEPVESNDITLHVGDKFNKIKEIGNGWAIGTNQTTGETGVFPEAYVKKPDTMDIAGGIIRRFTSKKPNKSIKRLEEGNLSTVGENPDTETSFTPNEQEATTTTTTTTEGESPTNKSSKRKKSRSSTVPQSEGEPHGDNDADALVAMQMDKIETFVPSENDEEDGDETIETNISEDEDNTIVTDEQLMLQPSKGKTSREARGETDATLTVKQKIFQTDRGEFEQLKAIIGAVFGFIAGVSLFILLVFSFKFGYDIAGYIAIPFTLLSVIGLAMSVHARCVGLLMIPSLSTGKGRAALLSIIFGLLLSGPITNIANNASKVSESMACSTQLIYNQSQDLKQQLQDPINEISNKVDESARKLKALGKGILSAWEPIAQGLNAINNGIQSVSGALSTASEECKRVFTDSYDKCVKEINGAKSKCVNAINSIPIVGRKRRKRAEVYSFLRRYKFIDLALQHSKIPSHRYKRALSDVCKVLDISSVCNALKFVKNVCTPVDQLDEVANNLANAANNELSKIEDWFEFDVRKEIGLSGLINLTKSVADFISEVQLDIDTKTFWVIFTVNLGSKLLALTLVLLILQSLYYLKNYLAKDEYNNIYITSFFKKYDYRRKKEGKPHVLPLSKEEKKTYIDTTSLRMGKAELLTSGIGMAQILLHMMIALIIVFFDYVLWFCLALVARYSKVNISVTGQTRILLKVTGSGAIAKLLQSLITGIDVQGDYAADYNITTCLPTPIEPQYNQTYAYITLYTLTIICVFLEGFGMRLRRKICAYYYPEQERDRIIYLHRKIRHHRKAAQLKVESYRKFMKS